MMKLSYLVLFALCSMVSSQVPAPSGKAPATVLSKRVLSNGDVEILVPYEETFFRNGDRVAYVTHETCVRTVINGGRARQFREKCLPRVIIADPIIQAPTTTTTTTTSTTTMSTTTTTTTRAPIATQFPHPYPYPYPYPNPDNQVWYLVLRRFGYSDYVVPYSNTGK